MNPEEKQANKVGPGGYKCICCGPAPKDRPKWRRKVKRRLSAIYRQQIRKTLKESQDE